ncbi:MAG: hypothetical protein LBL90_06910, partial [Prevotellaceae bacterium]|nr:hypothetical protein [Prevotellaceae bacterium]
IRLVNWLNINVFNRYFHRKQIVSILWNMTKNAISAETRSNAFSGASKALEGYALVTTNLILCS